MRDDFSLAVNGHDRTAWTEGMGWERLGGRNDPTHPHPHVDRYLLPSHAISLK